MPYLQKALTEKAVLDLKPFANDTRAKIAAALKEFARRLESTPLAGLEQGNIG